MRLTERFWSKVNKTQSCWLWTGAKAYNGYGFFYIAPKKQVRAHRAMLLSLGIIIPDGHVVMHLCDTPSCVRPTHLRVGTCKENSNDASQKGRLCHGEQHALHKLNASQVKRIKNHLRFRSRLSIANEYKVSWQTINRIFLGQTWKHI